MNHTQRSKLRRLYAFAGISTLVIGLTGCPGELSNLLPEIPIGGGTTYYAIAITQTRPWAWIVTSNDSAEAAENAALTGCRNEHNRACQLPIRAFTNCGAIAIGESRGRYGYSVASAEDRQTAINEALRGCRDRFSVCQIARPSGRQAVYGNC